MQISKYDTCEYPFHEMVQEMFSLKVSAEAIHDLCADSSEITFEKDTMTFYQKTFYSSPLYDSFRDLYYAFVKNEISKLFPGENYLVVQKDPQFRVCSPDKTALGVKSSDINGRIGMHCDADYNHPPQEKNFIVAITEMWDSNSVYIETSPNSDVFNPLILGRNEYVMFDGNRCRHYNMLNKTGQSRVSLDFRIIPFSDYDSHYEKQSVHGKRTFTIGDYFIKIPINDKV